MAFVCTAQYDTNQIISSMLIRFDLLCLLLDTMIPVTNFRALHINIFQKFQLVYRYTPDFVPLCKVQYSAVLVVVATFNRSLHERLS